MASLYILFIISVIGLVFYRMIKKKSTPSNSYTPYDDITMGVKGDMKQDHPVQDTKHQMEYEERAHKDETL